MSTVFDSPYVYMTLDASGKIWYLDEEKLPVNTELTVAEISNNPLFTNRRPVRVVGFHQNAALLIQLHNLVQQGAVKYLEVASPVVIQRSIQEPIQEPAVNLYRSRNCFLPASTGGWRQFSEADLYAFSMHISSMKNSSTMLYELSNHPIWPALSFINNIRMNAVANLVGLILDPRMYVDPMYPEKTNQLNSFLGLDPKSQKKQTKQNQRAERYKLVIDCWKTTPPTYDTVVTQPGNFLWAKWYTVDSPEKADLATSKLFIQYLRMTWLDAVVENKTDRLFIPKYFFTNPLDIDAFSKISQKTSKPNA